MPDSKISSLTELTTFDTNDELLIVDKSDTTAPGSWTVMNSTKFTPTAAANVENGSIFIDSADNVFKQKSIAGAVSAL